MKNMFKFLSAVLLVSLLGCSSSGKKANVEVPSYQQVKLKNGLTVLLIQDTSLPYVSYLMLVKAGSAEDPVGQKGLSSLVGDLLDQGSTLRSSTELADSLGQIGARFNVSTTLDYTMVTATGLSYHQDSLLKDFSEILTQPAFSQKEVDRMKSQRVSQLKATVDEPDDLAEVAFDQYLFGSHPYGQRTLGTLADVRKMTKKQITKYYLQNFRPNNSMLAVVGQFDAKQMQAKLEAAFKDWSPREVSEFKFPETAAINGIQIQVVDKSDLKQTQIRIGHLGIARTNPDFLTLRVANTILGGAFASRLMQEIREKRGLTYSVSSSFGAYKDAGPFAVSTFTRPDKIKETVETTLNVLKEFQEKGVTEQEVEDAKNYLMGIFPRSLETKEALATNLLALKFYGISESYLKDYIRNIQKISAKDVNKAIKAHIHPNNLKVLVFSPKAQAVEQLKDLGPIEVKSYRDFL